MATRDELYAKFGVTAEAAQLFETALGTLILCVRGLEEGWHAEPDGEAARRLLLDIDRKTLGGLLANLRESFLFDDDLTDLFATALNCRNRVNHGFFERHNYAIATAEGRDAMVADLEQSHQRLFDAWQMASRITTAFNEAFLAAREQATGIRIPEPTDLPKRPVMRGA
ncbi:hypothetical protein GCM10011390_21590 [Aureimonas endophytica]|uniref:Uncharacterized protein n=1 Tax=Aureimonas endophytica TaxID=2027858 RepID=A0A916ZLJ4_9HYPH|nr:hypothetical protein [Aureimonas endophytica]GGE02403.1 hypothetical protein GCM10011390_21590 [Aureimonas endophytica]